MYIAGLEYLNLAPVKLLKKKKVIVDYILTYQLSSKSSDMNILLPFTVTVKERFIL